MRPKENEEMCSKKTDEMNEAVKKFIAKNNIEVKSECSHCWHHFSGPIWMVIREGFCLIECCHCHTTRQIHRDHAGDYVGGRNWERYVERWKPRWMSGPKMMSCGD